MKVLDGPEARVLSKRRRSRISAAQTFASFRNYNFRLYWIGQLVSQVGTWMQVVAQAWLVLQLTHSPIALGAVSALQFTPVLIIVLFAGVVVDRLPKHRLLLATQSVALTQAVALAILTATGHIQLWEIYVLAAVLGLVNAFDNPTRQSFMMELVGRDQVVNAVGLNSAQFNSARLLGPAIGGLIIARWGVDACFFLNALSFLAVLISLLLLRTDQFRAVPERRVNGRMIAELGEGMRFLSSAPDLMVVIIVLAGIGCFGYNLNTVIPLLAQNSLHVGAGGFGLLMSALGVGSLIAALGMASGGRSSQRLLLLAATGFGVTYFTLSFVPWFGLAFVLLVLVGLFSQTFATSGNTLLQLGSPDRLRGRVMAVFTLLMIGSTPIGGLLTGLLAEWAGVEFTIAAEALMCLLAVGLALAYRMRMNTSSLPTVYGEAGSGDVRPDSAAATRRPSSPAMKVSVDG